MRIACLNHLIRDLKYPKGYIDVEVILKAYGAGGKNNLRADIVIYDEPIESLKARYDGDIPLNHIFAIGENKIREKQREDALKFQLFPAADVCPKLKHCIYWDETNRDFWVRKDKKYVPIKRFPKFNTKTTTNFLHFDDLHPVLSAKEIIHKIDQEMHNVGFSKRQRYEEVFKLLIAKYHDEKNCQEEGAHAEFVVKEDESDASFKQRFSDLYSDAYTYYKSYAKMESKLISKKIIINPKTIKIIKNCVLCLEKYSLLKTNQAIIQEFFMHFASEFYKKDLAQYYTPQEIVDFMVGLVQAKSTQTYIDPAGGSGDFLVGVIKKGVNQGLKNNLSNNVHYWDVNSDACVIANLNMMLNGDGKSNIEHLDSIKESSESNGVYTFCLTNPPFGEKTKYSGNRSDISDYELSKDSTELGILFVERDIRLLKNNGYLIIILPNGYLNNPQRRYLREFLFKKVRIVGCIALPDNVFKKSGAGGKTSILIAQKTTKIPDEYDVFMATADKVGFHHRKKGAPPLYKRDEETGDLFYEEEGSLPLVDNDLIQIQKQFRQFAYDNNLPNLEKKDSGTEYYFAKKSEILKDNYRAIRPSIYMPKYQNIVESIKSEEHACLSNIGAVISNDEPYSKADKEVYDYLETRNVSEGAYEKIQKFRGWELPGRAKQLVKEGDILVAKLEGSVDKFCMILEDNPRLVATNGFWRIRIEDKMERNNFYAFLFSKEFSIQMTALATGSIMADTKEDDMVNSLWFPRDKVQENYDKVEKMLVAQKKFLQTIEALRGWKI